MSFSRFPIDITTKELGIFKYGISYLPPKQIYDTIFLDLINIEDEFKWSEVIFSISYQDEKRNKYNLEFKLKISTLHYTLIKDGT